jgi:hypothetical protein
MVPVMDFIRARKCALAAGLVAALAGCSPRQEAAAPAPAAAPPAPPPAPVTPPTPPSLGRGELLGVVDAAAAATAAGGAYPERAAALAGRRFALRLPFGCAGPEADARSGWTYNAEREVLKISVQPQIWTETPWVRDLVGTEATEAIEGFWLRRPWMTAETCPPREAAPPAEPAAPAQPQAKPAPAPEPEPAIAPAPETVGLARVFQEGGSRLPRRGGRAYEVTEKLPPEPPPGQGGFRLVLEGRIGAPEDGRPIRCRSVHPDRRPVCLVLVEVDRVAVEAADGRQVAEWAG